MKLQEKTAATYLAEIGSTDITKRSRYCQYQICAKKFSRFFDGYAFLGNENVQQGVFEVYLCWIVSLNVQMKSFMLTSLDYNLRPRTLCMRAPLKKVRQNDAKKWESQCTHDISVELEFQKLRNGNFGTAVAHA